MIAEHILMQPVQNLNAITILVQLMYVVAAILVESFQRMMKLKRFLQKMNMKRFLYSINLLNHLDMVSPKEIVDIKQVLNLLIPLNISTIS